MSVQAAKVDVEYSIKPEAVTPAVDTSTWPLLLKNYDKRKSFFPLLLSLREIIESAAFPMLFICRVHRYCLWKSCYIREAHVIAYGSDAIAMDSIRTNWTLHTHTERKYTAQARSKIIYKLWCHQSRQAFEPVQPRGCVVG